MDIEEIDMIDTEPLQRCFEFTLEMSRGIVEVPGAG
jgi:hypothetical protein